MATPTPATRPGGRRVLGSRAALSVALIGGMLAGTAVATTVAVRSGRADARAAWDDQAQRAVSVLRREVTAMSGTVEELRALAGLGSTVEAAPFRAIARGPVATGTIATATWSPRVPAQGRAAFAATTGRPVTVPGPDGATPPARGPAPSYPVLHAQPPADRGGPPVGLDITSPPVAREARARALAGPETLMSGPYALWPDGAVGAVIVARAPAAAGRPADGVVAATFRGEDLRIQTLRSLDEGTEIQVTDAGRRLFGPPEGIGEGAERTMVVLGRRWTVTLRGPERAGWATPALVLGAGLWLTLMVGLLLQDNAERARAERELRRRVDYDAALLSAIQDGLVILDAEGTVLEANQRFCDMVGLGREHVIGATPPYAWWPEEHVAANSARLAEVSAHGAGEHDLVFRRRGGGLMYVIASRAAIVGRDGRPGGFLSVVKDVTERRRSEDEQSALRRVSFAVASGLPPQELFARVAGEVAGLLDAQHGVVARFGDDGIVVVGHTGRSGPGTEARTALGHVRRGEPGLAPGEVAAPIRLEGRLWGGVAAAVPTGGALPDGSQERLERFADLVGLSIANASARAELVAQATTDPLTGLANRRVLEERLEAEAERALRYGRALSLVQLDLDRFKEVNDTFGHPAGDEVLRELARRLRARRRSGDLVSRLGGEEFAWLMPETDGVTAFTVAERLRREIGEEPFAGVGRVTVSLGVCDLAAAGGPARLVDLADAALYRAKRRGRDRTILQVPGAASALASALESGDADPGRLHGELLALAADVDAREAPRERHSAHVAVVAVAVARELGWQEEGLALLRDAALCHDVGKAGVPEAVLSAPRPLAQGERRAMQAHPLLGAQIALGLLSGEQVSWIRGHHERPDGSGYPDGLVGDRVPEGARILAVAEAWAGMTEERPWRRARTRDEAAAECRVRAGGGLWAPAVEALLRLEAAGRLPRDGPHPVHGAV